MIITGVFTCLVRATLGCCEQQNLPWLVRATLGENLPWLVRATLGENLPWLVRATLGENLPWLVRATLGENLPWLVRATLGENLPWLVRATLGENLPWLVRSTLDLIASKTSYITNNIYTFMISFLLLFIAKIFFTTCSSFISIIILTFASLS